MGYWAPLSIGLPSPPQVGRVTSSSPNPAAKWNTTTSPRKLSPPDPIEILNTSTYRAGRRLAHRNRTGASNVHTARFCNVGLGQTPNRQDPTSNWTSQCRCLLGLYPVDLEHLDSRIDCTSVTPFNVTPHNRNCLHGSHKRNNYRPR